MSFGGGMHVCLGMNLVAGTVLRDGESPKPDNHQFGTITLIIKELIERGMRPNPEQAPQKIEGIRARRLGHLSGAFLIP
jgi:hypothetical protein